MPMIILRDEEDKRSLPIWVGLPEANAIAMELEKMPVARPMTHDLIKSLLETVGARVVKVEVNDLRQKTFFAQIHLLLGSKAVTVDSRPSDAIALALRVEAPIFVAEEVLGKAESVEVKVGREGREPEGGAPKTDDPAQIKKWLESLKPGDFEVPERGGDPKPTDE
jgi:bifunctional DNase/RNase